MATGIFTISLEVCDPLAACDAASTSVVVYDPSGAFVTGGGWITSQAGDDLAHPDAAGRATFGFVSKYKKGANTPSGNTEFQFKDGDLNFHSSSYDWLVVAGPLAQFRGSGTINGVGDFEFLIRATDGQVSGGDGVDRFRIQIWGAGGMRYDNQGDDELIRGSVVIHGK